MAKELSCYPVLCRNTARTERTLGALEKPRDATRVDIIIGFLRRDKTRAFLCATPYRHNI